MILIFEGPDKSGKTTLRELIRKERNHKDVTIDRLFGSMIVYGSVFKRNIDGDEANFYMKERMFESFFQPLLIYCQSPIGILRTRMRRLKHEPIDKDTLEKTLKKYNEYFANTKYHNKVEIDTSIYSERECIDLIMKKIERIEETSSYKL